MIALLESPRRRRKVAWGTLLALPVAALAVALFVLGNTAEPYEVSAPPPGPAEPVATPPSPPIVVTPEVRGAVDAVVERFVRTAVVRERPAAAWTLASARMREGVTREQWARGEVPVQPYPPDVLGTIEWRLVYVDGSTLALEVVLMPKEDSGGNVQVYAADVRVVEEAGRRRFLVDQWAPLATLPTGAQGRRAAPGVSRAAGQAAEARERGRPFAQARLGAAWFIVPGALFALLLLTPLVLVARGVVADRRAQQRYREHGRR